MSVKKMLVKIIVLLYDKHLLKGLYTGPPVRTEVMKFDGEYIEYTCHYIAYMCIFQHDVITILLYAILEGFVIYQKNL